MAYIDINSVKAFTLFDSGCTLDAVSPDLVKVARLDPAKLDKQLGLQLSTRGSRARINYGVITPLKYHMVSAKPYMDVLNIDMYNAVIGCSLIRQLKISLDFDKDVIRIKGGPPLTRTPQEDEPEALHPIKLREGEGILRPNPVSSIQRK